MATLTRNRPSRTKPQTYIDDEDKILQRKIKPAARPDSGIKRVRQKDKVSKAKKYDVPEKWNQGDSLLEFIQQLDQAAAGGGEKVSKKQQPIVPSVDSKALQMSQGEIDTDSKPVSLVQAARTLNQALQMSQAKVLKKVKDKAIQQAKEKAIQLEMSKVRAQAQARAQTQAIVIEQDDQKDLPIAQVIAQQDIPVVQAQSQFVPQHLFVAEYKPLLTQQQLRQVTPDITNDQLTKVIRRIDIDRIEDYQAFFNYLMKKLIRDEKLSERFLNNKTFLQFLINSIIAIEKEDKQKSGRVFRSPLLESQNFLNKQYIFRKIIQNLPKSVNKQDIFTKVEDYVRALRSSKKDIKQSLRRKVKSIVSDKSPLQRLDPETKERYVQEGDLIGFFVEMLQKNGLPLQQKYSNVNKLLSYLLHTFLQTSPVQKHPLVQTPRIAAAGGGGPSIAVKVQSQPGQKGDSVLTKQLSQIYRPLPYNPQAQQQRPPAFNPQLLQAQQQRPPAFNPQILQAQSLQQVAKTQVIPKSFQQLIRGVTPDISIQKLRVVLQTIDLDRIKNYRDFFVSFLKKLIRDRKVPSSIIREKAFQEFLLHSLSLIMKERKINHSSGFDEFDIYRIIISSITDYLPKLTRQGLFNKVDEFVRELRTEKHIESGKIPGIKRTFKKLIGAKEPLKRNEGMRQYMSRRGSNILLNYLIEMMQINQVGEQSARENIDKFMYNLLNDIFERQGKSGGRRTNSQEIM